MSGWHRLWVSIGVLYLFVILIVLWIVYPRTEDLYKNWYIMLFNSVKEYNSNPVLQSQDAEDFQLQHPNLDYRELILYLENEMKTHPDDYRKCLDSKPRNLYCMKYPHDGTIEREIWGKKLKLLNIEQNNLILLAFWVWTLPLFVLYILGWLIKWVWNGFNGRDK